MSWFYRRIIRPVLFAQEAERIHERTLRLLGGVSRHKILLDITAAFCSAPALPVELFGLRFPNPVGLAAGMDKWAQATPAWRALGFGFSELGAVTWRAQPGNPPPRHFRALADEAVVNSMGFNNPGAVAFAEALARWQQEGRRPDHPVGVNLGRHSHIELIKSLLIESIGRFELGVRGLHSFPGRNHLEVSTAHRKDHQVSRIPRGELSRAIDLMGRPVIVPCGQIDNRLSEAAAQVEVVKRSHDRRDGEARQFEVEPLRREICLLYNFGQIPT